MNAYLQRKISNLRLVAPTPGTIDYNVVQPDIIVSNSTELVFIEMKVDSRSSIDQFAKYAIAAHCIVQDEPKITSVDLVLLARHTDPQRVWKHATKLGLTSEQAVREVALRALQHDATIWGERGVQRYTRAYPQAIPSLEKLLLSMGLHLADYASLETALRNYAADEATVSRLIHGVLQEFARRNLVDH